jgi:hypothetical protein
MNFARIGFVSFYGLGWMLLFLVIGTAVNFILAQAPFRRRDAENLGTAILIALIAAVLRAFQLLLPQIDNFLLRLLALVLAFFEIVLTAVMLVYITGAVQQRPAWTREGTNEFIIIWLGSILIIGVVMALHRPIYFGCGIILIAMSGVILIGSILNLYQEQHNRRQHAEKSDDSEHQIYRCILKKPGRSFYRIISQLLFSTAGIVLGNILIHLE